jgi:hypothetical protein
MDEFKTAKELGIKAWEREGLVKTLRLFETVADLAVRAERPNLNDEQYRETGSRAQKPKFRMSTPANEFECGTALCIGGWAYFFGKGNDLEEGLVSIDPDLAKGIHQYVLDDRSERLYPLFFGDLSARLPRAQRTLRHYLETGETDWDLDAYA